MENTKIHYIFGIGRRCNVTRFLRVSRFTKFASPFDWLICDFETALDCLKNNFSLFLTNIVNYQKESHFSSCNTSTPEIHQELKETFDKSDLCYMKHDYNKLLLRINTNYLPKTISNDFYQWDRILMYPHHNPGDKNDKDKFIRRIERLQELLKNHLDNTLLFYMDKIVEEKDEITRTKTIEEIYDLYNVPAKICYIMCVVTKQPFRYKKYKKLTFIYFPVNDYETQLKTFRATDNNIIDKTLDWERLYISIRTLYDIDVEDVEDVLE